MSEKYFSRATLRTDVTPTVLNSLFEKMATERTRKDKTYSVHRLLWTLFDNTEEKQRDFIYRQENALEQGVSLDNSKAPPVFYVVSSQRPNASNEYFNIETKPYDPFINVGQEFSFKLRINAVVTRNNKRHDLSMNAQHDWLLDELKKIGKEKQATKSVSKQILLDYASDAEIRRWSNFIENGPFFEVLEQQVSRSQTLEWALKTEVFQTFQSWWRNKLTGKFDQFPYGMVALPINSGDHCIEVSSDLKHRLPEKGKQASFNSVDLTGKVKVTDVDKFKKTLFEGMGPAKGFGCGLMLVKRAN